ncbi:MAG: SusF/SusE family outer membrane protein [Paludibacteraceae bacterium]|nr:SusF/SusE family outer membrane protein [Paludibacteraceae bacterium]
MKKLHIIFAVFISAVILASCDTREPAIKSITPSVIGEVPTDTLDIRSIMKTSDTLCVITWTPAVFNTEKGSVDVAPITYNLEFDKFGNGFVNAKPYAIIQGNNTSVVLPTVDFGSWVLSNITDAKGGEAITMEIRVKAQYGDGETYTYSSNAPKLTIIPYGLQPMYVVGEWNNWDTKDISYRMFRDTNDSNDFTYTFTGKMKGSFKLMGKDAVGTQELYYNAGDGKLNVGVHEGDAFVVPEEGYYTIKIDLNSMTFTLDAYDTSKSQTKGKDFTSNPVGFIGDFNSWGAIEPMQQDAYDPHLWRHNGLSVTSGYAKWTTKSLWSGKWCPVDNNMPYGLSDYNPTAHDNCIVPETGTYLLILNDMTGYYIAERIN